jgi:hypothetical protein
MGVRRLGWRRGSEDTTSGSSRVFSVRSMAATKSFGARENTGAEKTLTASASQVGQGTVSVAWPIGRLISTTPCRSQQYSYQAKSHPPLLYHGAGSVDAPRRNLSHIYDRKALVSIPNMKFTWKIHQAVV